MNTLWCKLQLFFKNFKNNTSENLKGALSVDKTTKTVLEKVNFDRFKDILQDRRFLIFLHDLCVVAVAVNLAAWFTLGDIKQMLLKGFVQTQVITYSLIAGGFFIWFQTYKGFWRYMSLRQGTLILGVMGFASIIYFPIVTKAQVQPVDIPGIFVLACWGISSSILVGSRFFIRLFYERWFLTETQEFVSEPQSRLIVVGGDEPTKQFLQKAKRFYSDRYEILGVVDSRLAGATHKFAGFDVLGRLSDLPEVIESFNADSLHPHHIVIVDQDYYGKKARALVRNLAPYKVDFKTIKSDAKADTLVPLTLSELYTPSSQIDHFPALGSENLLILGHKGALGQAFLQLLKEIGFKGQVVLADFPGVPEGSQDVEIATGAQGVLKSQQLNQESSLTQSPWPFGVQDYPLVDTSKKGLLSLIENARATRVINLLGYHTFNQKITSGQSEIALVLELLLNLNHRLIESVQEKQVQGLYIAHSQAPHHKSITETIKLLDHFIKDQQESIPGTQLELIELPYVLVTPDVSLEQGTLRTLQQNLKVTTTGAACDLLYTYLVAHFYKKAWDPHEVLDALSVQVSYQDLLKDNALLKGKLEQVPDVTLEMNRLHNFIWKKPIMRNLFEHLEAKRYQEAARDLDAFYVSE